MTINYPTSLDTFSDPSATDRLDNPPHDVLHTDINSAVEALQAKVGADSSAVTTSHDYKITQLEGKSPTITLAGDASGSVTLTNLGSGTLTVTVADDSHSHSYLPLSGGTLTGHTTHGYNIATPANYYNGLQLEVQATSGTAGIGLHRSGYSHVGIYHDATNSLKFNMNSGTVTLNHNTGTIWGSGNDGSGSGLDADTVDGLQAANIGQRLVMEVGVGNGVTYVQVNNAFSSAYSHYRVLMDDVTSSGDWQVSLRLGTGVTGPYYVSLIYNNYATNQILSVTTSNNRSQINWIGGNKRAVNGSRIVVDFMIYYPYKNEYTFVTSNAYGTNATTGTTQGVLANTTSYTNFQIIADGGTMSGGSVKVYGYL